MQTRRIPAAMLLALGLGAGACEGAKTKPESKNADQRDGDRKDDAAPPPLDACLAPQLDPEAMPCLSPVPPDLGTKPRQPDPVMTPCLTPPREPDPAVTPCLTPPREPDPDPPVGPCLKPVPPHEPPLRPCLSKLPPRPPAEPDEPGGGRGAPPHASASDVLDRVLDRADLPADVRERLLRRRHRPT
jgi:hypothetical protein